MSTILDILIIIFGLLSFACVLIYSLAGILLVYKRDKRIKELKELKELKEHCLYLMPGAIKVLAILAILILIDYLK